MARFLIFSLIVSNLVQAKFGCFFGYVDSKGKKVVFMNNMGETANGIRAICDTSRPFSHSSYAQYVKKLKRDEVYYTVCCHAKKGKDKFLK